MQHRLRTLGAAFAAVAALMAIVTVAPKADARPALAKNVVGTLHQVIAGSQKYDDSSLNWGGYYVNAVSGQPITEASTMVVTPKPKLLPPTLSASWVGIGGTTSTDLIQAGVAFGYNDGYYAWYEMLPDAMIPITSGCSTGNGACPVTFDDQIAVNIKLVGDNLWNISINNVGKWTWSHQFPYQSTYSSAEWIYEAPQTTYAGLVPLLGLPANLDHANFFGNTYVAGGQSKQLAAADAVKSNVSPIGIVNLATPSAIRGDSAFAVCPYKQSCATP